jgi:hypothetical protein
MERMNSARFSSLPARVRRKLPQTIEISILRLLFVMGGMTIRVGLQVAGCQGRGACPENHPRVDGSASLRQQIYQLSLSHRHPYPTMLKGMAPLISPQRLEQAPPIKHLLETWQLAEREQLQRLTLLLHRHSGLHVMSCCIGVCDSFLFTLRQR